MDRRTLYQRRRTAEGNCPQGNHRTDRPGRICSRCLSAANTRFRQRYRPGMRAAEWTMAFLARSSAVEMRGCL